MRPICIGIVVLGLVLAWGVAFGETWEGVEEGVEREVVANAEVKSYILIDWQDTVIVFVNEVPPGGPGDWYRARGDGLIGIYRALTAADKSSCDAWADGYYESRDGARFYIAANDPVRMYVHQKGDLSDGLGHTIPTWYTIAATGHWTNGFMRNSAWMSDGQIPFDGNGVYGGIQGVGDPNPLILDLGAANGCAFYPNQEAIPMAPASMTRTLALPPVTRGTIMFKARMLRTQLGSWELIPDVGGTYTATLNVSFTCP